MSRTYTEQSAARRYESARALPQKTSALWMKALRNALPLNSFNRILDLGSGTGRFAASLQEEFQCLVIDVDPSEVMLAQGRSRGLNNIVWEHGSAENIPLDANSVDLVWMSQIFHHLESPLASLREIRRVLSPVGYLAIRNGTLENNEEIEWFHCFPEAKQIDDKRLPSHQDIIELVCGLRFESISGRTVYQFSASSYAEYYRKIRQRGLSSLISISDETFNAGLERLERWVALQPPDQPVNEPVDLFIFRVNK